MGFDSDLGNTESGADLLVQTTRYHQLHDFPFAYAEGLVALLECPGALKATHFYTALVHGQFDGVQEHFVRERLGQKLKCAGFHCPNCCTNVDMATHENYLEFRAVQDELLQLKAA
jgi:hypothetical protein